jgi:cell division protein FtsW (lipid II flippase)
LVTSSSNEESSSLEEELPFVFFLFAFSLSFLFSAVSFSSYLMRSSKDVAFEALILEPSSMMIGLPSSSNFGGTSSISPVLKIASLNG